MVLGNRGRVRSWNGAGVQRGGFIVDAFKVKGLFVMGQCGECDSC